MKNWLCPPMFKNPSSEFTGETNEAEHALSPAPETNHRQSDRVFLTIPIRVSCIRGRGEVFLEEGQTTDISRQGATVKVDRELYAGEIVKVQRLDGAGKEVMARVVGRVARGSEGYLFGLVILDPAIANPWGIVFPALADMYNAVLRALLRCVSCERTEVTYLNEFEADLLSATTISPGCASSAVAGPRGTALMTIPPRDILPPRPLEHKTGGPTDAFMSRRWDACGIPLLETKLWSSESWRGGA